MLSFPQLLYPMQIIPLLIKQLDINKLNLAFTDFIWASKTAHISLKKLMTKAKGGIHLLNVCKYNLTSILRNGLDCIQGTNYFSNIHLESSLVAPWSLGALLHTRFMAIPKPLRTSLILHNTVATWKA